MEHSATLSAADLVLLQEMTPEGAAAVAHTLGMGHAYRSASTHRFHGREFGNAILSRWPIIDESAVDLPHQAAWHGEQRIATTATVRICSTDVSVYSAHTETPVLRLARRIEQFDRIAAHVSSRSANLVIVGGDFNTITARARDALAVSMKRAHLHVVSSRGVPTLERFGVSLLLDQVFAAGFVAVGGGVQPHEGASDHQPVWVDLKPPSAPG